MKDKPATFTGSRVVDGTLAKFEPIMNPQNWQENVKTIWTTSRIIQDDQVPPNRAANPQTIDPIDVWEDRLLFEVVTLPLLSEHRNVLLTSFIKEERAIRFKYDQHECLTSVFLGEQAEGGIDVDTGGATCELNDDNASVTFTVSKTVRFTEPTDMLPLVEAISSVAVKMVLELLLLGIS